MIVFLAISFIYLLNLLLLVKSYSEKIISKSVTIFWMIVYSGFYLIVVYDISQK